jgi:hypothetical protein
VREANVKEKQETVKFSSTSVAYKLAAIMVDTGCYSSLLHLGRLSENAVSFTSTYITSFPDESNKVCNYIHQMKAPESPARLILDMILGIAFHIQLNGMLTSPFSSRHFPTKIIYACPVYPIQACSRASLSQFLQFPSFVLHFRG